MRAVVQRVSGCSVTVGASYKREIGEGLLVYLGVSRNDEESDLQYIADKVSHLRIFPDSAGKMNLSLLDTQTDLMVISQFTLFGDVRRGRRPSYTDAAQPEKAKALYDRFINVIQEMGILVESGVFAALMKVTYTNDGPVTIILDSEKKF